MDAATALLRISEAASAATIGADMAISHPGSTGETM